MADIWEQVLRTAIAGAERSPVPEPVLAVLGIAASEDPARTALQALPAACLLRKAAAPLAAAHGCAPDLCPPDERPLCDTAILHPLKALLQQDTLADALPEFFDVLRQSGKRLPPEVLPMILDYLARKKTPPGIWQYALGPASLWLARQNPDWAELFPGEEQADWHTSMFAERLALLRVTRQTDPAAGLALLEKTWGKERGEHKIRFLEALRTGLSPADESFLETAAAETKNAVHRTALRLLLLIPESALRKATDAGLRQQLAGLPETQFAGVLQRLARPGAEKGPLDRFRPVHSAADPDAPLIALLNALPPRALAQASGLPAPAILQAMDTESTPEPVWDAWLRGICWHADPEWLEAVVRHFIARPGHTMWQSEALAQILQALPEARWQAAAAALAQLAGPLLEDPDSALVRALRDSVYTWPGELLHALLRYPQYQGGPRHWTVPRHFYALLQRAAFCCRPEDAESLPGIEQDWPYAAHSEIARFRTVIQFRRRMRSILLR